MKEYVIKVTVDEDALKEASGLEDIHEALMQEAGWLHDSGIFVDSVEESGNGPEEPVKVTAENLESLYWNQEGNIYVNGEPVEGFSMEDIRNAMDNGCTVEYKEGSLPGMPDRPVVRKDDNGDDVVLDVSAREKIYREVKEEYLRDDIEAKFTEMLENAGKDSGTFGKDDFRLLVDAAVPLAQNTLDNNEAYMDGYWLSIEYALKEKLKASGVDPDTMEA